MSCAMPSTMPSPARRIGTSASFFPRHPDAPHALERVSTLLSRAGRSSSPRTHEHGDFIHQLLEILGGGVLVRKIESLMLISG